MVVYTPHGESVVQTVFRKSRTSYEGYASPPADTLARVDEFLACADWTRGVARVKCTACDYSYFRPFSCKTFHLCPSCDKKRTILYAEYLAEELLLELPHRQFVFTVPKILRPYFKNDKRLFGEVSRLIFELLSGFFSLAAQRELQCACVASYQSFGEFARFHPHWHVLVLEGGFDQWGRFVYLPLGCDAGLLKLWQESILALFLTHKLIEQDRATMIRSWVHSGFSVESETRMLDKPTKEALGQYAVRGAVSEQRISYDSSADLVTWSARANGFFDGKVETFKGFEFIDQLVAHLPPRRAQLVRRYGIYSSRVRSKWTELPKITRFAPEGWTKAHKAELELAQDSPESAELPEVPDSWARLRKKNWARLLKKVYEVDPFLCPNCGGTMVVVGVIEDPVKLKAIIEWATAQQSALPEVRGPPIPQA